MTGDIPSDTNDAALEAALHGVLRGASTRHVLEAVDRSSLVPSLPEPARLQIRDRAAIISRHLHPQIGPFQTQADQIVGDLVARMNSSATAYHRVASSPVAAEVAQAHAQGGLPGSGQYSSPVYHGLPPTPPLNVARLGHWVQDFERRLVLSAQTNAHPHIPEVTHAPQASASDAVVEDMAEPGGADQHLQESSQELEQLLAHTNHDRLRGSQFVQFVSKMSRGELRVRDNGFVDRNGAIADGHVSHREPNAEDIPPAAATATAAAAVGASSHIAELDPVAAAATARAAAAAAAAVAERERRPSAGGSRIHGEQGFAPSPQLRQHTAAESDGMPDLGLTGNDLNEWMEDLEATYGPFDSQELDSINRLWADTYVRNLEQPLQTKYQFHNVNAYRERKLSSVECLTRGRELFHAGDLSEATLAVEAAVMQQPRAEVWHLLGMINAENDDDRQAIAASLSALELNPGDRESLLSLAVSYTNELDMRDALRHLRRWLRTHPTYGETVHGAAASRGRGGGGGVAQDVVDDDDGAATGPELLGQTIRLFEEAGGSRAIGHPTTDPDVLIALGVLYNLSRQHNQAAEKFQQALELVPDDYSTWNKLGATHANSGRSSQAIGSYKRALRKKPNYTRAWINMGIAHGNLGEYEQAARCYVQSLTMNPEAEAVWGYLHNAISGASRLDLVDSVNARNLTHLQQVFPLNTISLDSESE